MIVCVIQSGGLGLEKKLVMRVEGEAAARLQRLSVSAYLAEAKGVM